MIITRLVPNSNSKSYEAWDNKTKSRLELSSCLTELLNRALDHLSEEKKVLTSIGLYRFLVTQYSWKESEKVFTLNQIVRAEGEFGEGLDAVWKKFKKGMKNVGETAEETLLIADLSEHFISRMDITEPILLKAPPLGKESPFQFNDIEEPVLIGPAPFPVLNIQEQIRMWCSEKQLSVDLQKHLVHLETEKGFGKTERDLIATLTSNFPHEFSYYFQQWQVSSGPKVAFLQKGIHHALYANSGKRVNLPTSKPNFNPQRSPEQNRVSPTPQLTQIDIIKELCRDLSVDSGRLHDVTGREDILEAVEIIFGKMSTKNVMLLGEAGVGKTAIAEALQWRISHNKIPRLAGKRVLALDIGSLNSNTSLRGQFEERLNAVIQYAEENSNVILFIDEVHLLVGAGISSGSNVNGANLLKPALARGQLLCMAATTEKEYRLYIAKDDAFARRFELVHLPEPGRDDCIDILNQALPGLKVSYDRRFGVLFTIDPSAVSAAVDLSSIYLSSERRQPAKALQLLDTAMSLSVSMNEVTEARVRELLVHILIEEGRRLQYAHTKLTENRRERLSAATAYQMASNLTKASQSELASYFPDKETTDRVVSQLRIRAFALVTLLVVGLDRRTRQIGLSKLIVNLNTQVKLSKLAPLLIHELKARQGSRWTQGEVDAILDRLKISEKSKAFFKNLKSYKELNAGQEGDLEKELENFLLLSEKRKEYKKYLNKWEKRHMSFPFLTINEEGSYKFRAPSRLLFQMIKHLKYNEPQSLYESQLKMEKEVAQLLSSLRADSDLYAQFAVAASDANSYPLLNEVEIHLSSLFENNYGLADKWTAMKPDSEMVGLVSCLQEKLVQIRARTAMEAREAVAKLHDPSLTAQFELTKRDLTLLPHCQALLITHLNTFAPNEEVKRALQHLSKTEERVDLMLGLLSTRGQDDSIFQHLLTISEWVTSKVLQTVSPSLSIEDIDKSVGAELFLPSRDKFKSLMKNTLISIEAVRNTEELLQGWLSSITDPGVQTAVALYRFMSDFNSTSFKRADLFLQCARRELSRLQTLPYTRLKEDGIWTVEKREESIKSLSSALEALSQNTLFEDEARSIKNASSDARALLFDENQEIERGKVIAERVGRIWNKAKAVLKEELSRIRWVLPILIRKIGTEAKFRFTDPSTRNLLASDLKAIVGSIRGLVSLQLLEGKASFPGVKAFKRLLLALGKIALSTDRRSLAKRDLSRVLSSLKNQIANDQSELRYLMGGLPAALNGEMKDSSKELVRVTMPAFKVDAHRIALQLHRDTEISVSQLLASPVEAIRHMRQEFSRRVLGQSLAIRTLTSSIDHALSGIKDPEKPLGIYLLIGGTGNGKSLTGATLKEFLPSSQLLTYDMSEFSTPESVTTLIGSPSGYVNHEEGGRLTRDALLYPNGIFVFEELDQADPAVLRLLYQIMESGRLKDSSGVAVSFRNAIIVMTTNYRCDELQRLIPELDLGMKKYSDYFLGTLSEDLSSFFFKIESVSCASIIKKLFYRPHLYQAKIDPQVLTSLLEWVREGLRAFQLKYKLMNRLGVNTEKIDSDLEEMKVAIESSDFDYLFFGIEDMLRGCSSSLYQQLIWDLNIQKDQATYSKWKSWISKSVLFSHFPPLRFDREELFHRVSAPNEHLGPPIAVSTEKMIASVSLFFHLKELDRSIQTSSIISNLRQFLESLEHAELNSHDKNALRHLVGREEKKVGDEGGISYEEVIAGFGEVLKSLNRRDNLFSPAWVNRVSEVIPYFNLTPPLMRRIVELEWVKMSHFRALKEFEILYHPSAISYIADLVRPEIQDGARPVKRALDHELSRLIAERRESRSLPPSSRVFAVLEGRRLEIVDEKYCLALQKQLGHSDHLGDLKVDVHPQVVYCHQADLSEEGLAAKITRELKGLVNSDASHFEALIDYVAETKSWNISVHCLSSSEPLFFYTKKQIEDVEWAIREFSQKQQRAIDWGFDLPLLMLRAFGQYKLLKGDSLKEFVFEKIDAYITTYSLSVLETERMSDLIRGR